MRIDTSPHLIDWQSDQSHLFLNPRRPGSSVFHDLKSMEWPRLEGGHIWVSSAGTTGPKLVALSKAAFLNSARSVNHYLELKAGNRWLLSLPTFHVAGLASYARSFLLGSEIVDISTRPWSTEHFIKAIEDHQIQATSLVPQQVFDLIKQNLKAPLCLGWVLVGGGELEASLFAAATRLGWKLLPSYGMTELASTIAIATKALEFSKVAEEADDIPSTLGINSGTPTDGEQSSSYNVLPHCTVTIKEQADMLHFGRICIAGNSLATGFFDFGNIREQTPVFKPLTSKLLNAGLFVTSDIGQLAKNKLTIVGRIDDLVKISGELVNMTQLNRIMQAKKVNLSPTGKGECVLVAVESVKKGHQIKLLVTDDLWEISASLKADYEKEVHPYERVHQIVKLESFPKTTLGKLNKRELLKLI